MSGPKQASLPLLQCIRCTRAHLRANASPSTSIRTFTASTSTPEEAQAQQTTPPPNLDPALVSTRREERQLIRSGKLPIGSRRRRAALQTSSQIPFEQLPYQAFQEARKILQADREEKIHQIEVQRARIARLQAQDAAVSGGEMQKQTRLRSMQKRLEELKILADINDPLIKKRFEDGEGDMNRPIYRYLADRQWRSYKRLVLMQRISQMNVVPDVLPHVDPTVDVSLTFGRRNVQPGDFVYSRVSQVPAKLRVQVFDKGERLVTVVVVDSDVPNVEKDGFDYRCHFIASNIPISPTTTSLPLAMLSAESQVALPWLPPFAQKGSPYHRLSIFVLQQPEGKTIDVAAVRNKMQRDSFNLRSFIDKHLLKPVGVTMFRSQWDEGTAGVMKKAGIEGADVEFRREKIKPLPYKKKDGARYR